MDDKRIVLSDEEAQLAEGHRGFVREIDHRMGRSYGYGGGVVVVVVLILAVMGWFFSLLTSLMFWIPGVTAVLATIFMMRRRIYAHRDRLRGQVENYCQINGLSQQTLQAYYQAEELYPFFAAIYEEQGTKSL